tara:strand:- start:2916 stop:3113 length:198 start_codon:yes stop_codon:yes gene_type:complete
MNNPELHELTDKETPTNLSALNKKVEKEKKKLEKPHINPVVVFGKDYKEPKIKKKSNNKLNGKKN